MKFLKFLIFALAITFLFGVVVADDDDDDDRSQAKYGGGDAKQRLVDCNRVQRKVEFKEQGDEIELEVEPDSEEESSIDDEDKKKRKGKKCKSEMNMKLKTNSGDAAKVSVELKSENGDAKAKVKFSLKTERIVEFIDANNNGWDANDTIVQVYEIGTGYQAADGTSAKKDEAGSDPWIERTKGKWEMDAEDAVTAAGKCREFNATTKEGVFTIVGRYCPHAGIKFTRISGVEYKKNNVTYNVTLSYELNPNTVKFDFLVNGFNYKNDNTKLAVLAKLRTKQSFKIKHIGKVVHNKDLEEVDVDGGAAGISWSKKVYADGQEANVIMTSPDGGCKDAGGDECEHWYYFTFNKTGKVGSFLWDPEVVTDYGGQGANANAATSAAAPVFSAVVLLAAMFFN